MDVCVNFTIPRKKFKKKIQLESTLIWQMENGTVLLVVGWLLTFLDIRRHLYDPVPSFYPAKKPHDMTSRLLVRIYFTPWSGVHSSSDTEREMLNNFLIGVDKGWWNVFPI